MKRDYKVIATALMAALATMTSVHAKTGHPPNLFFARPDGDRGVAIAYDRSNDAVWARLPAGMLSADGSLFVSAEFVGDNDTRLTTFDAATGEETLCMPLQGRWSLSTVSPSGQFVALTRAASGKDKQAWAKSRKWQTEVQVIDTVARRPKHILTLLGNFEAEAISASGTSLFLVEHLPAAKPDHYAIRWYDLKNERLVADPLRSKTADEIMSGYAWGGTASADGDWLFTLYLSTNRKVAFIHMLNTKEGFTVCVDLPSGAGDFEALKGYTLAYSPKRQTVYAMNPRLGVVAEAKLGDYKLNGNKFVANKVVTFKPDAALKEAAAMSPTYSTVSSDGGLVYFAQGNQVYTYNSYIGSVVQPFRSNAPITGIALTEGNRHVLISQPNGPLVLFDGYDGRIVPTSELAAQRDDCPITRPASFVPPNRKPDLGPGEFWFGTDKLWTGIYHNGAWEGLPYNESGYTQKVFWWTKDYNWKDPIPELTVMGRRLDAPAEPLVVSPVTNAFGDDISSAMLVGVDFPTAGCWEITGKLDDAKLSFVVWVGP